MGGACSAYGEGRGLYGILVEKSGGKRTLGKPKIDIKMDFQELGSGCMDWIGLAQNRDRSWAFVNAVMNFRLYNLRNFLTI